MEYEEMSSYDKEMVAAFIAKPQKERWYRHAFERYSINGVDKMSWVWSWWAFAGGPFFLLYRKAYIAAGLLFAVSILISIIPFGGLIIWVLSGGYSTYFVYKVYQDKKRETEANVTDIQKRIQTMWAVGGTHEWVVWVAVVLMVMWLVGVAFIGMGTLVT